MAGSSGTFSSRYRKEHLLCRTDNRNSPPCPSGNLTRPCIRWHSRPSTVLGPGHGRSPLSIWGSMKGRLQHILPSWTDTTEISNMPKQHIGMRSLLTAAISLTSWPPTAGARKNTLPPKTSRQPLSWSCQNRSDILSRHGQADDESGSSPGIRPGHIGDRSPYPFIFMNKKTKNKADPIRLMQDRGRASRRSLPCGLRTVRTGYNGST